jgi:hypothetical protein
MGKERHKGIARDPDNLILCIDRHRTGDNAPTRNSEVPAARFQCRTTAARISKSILAAITSLDVIPVRANLPDRYPSKISRKGRRTEGDTINARCQEMSNMAHVNKPCAHVRSNNHSPIADAAMNAAIRRAPQVVLNSAMTAYFTVPSHPTSARESSSR